MVTRPARALTYEDYSHFPDDGRRWELIDGEAYGVPSPDVEHQDLILRLAHWVMSHLEEHGGGRVFVAPLDVVLSDIDVLQPDLIFVSDADAEVVTPKHIRGTPTWLVEVVSDPVRDKRSSATRTRATASPSTGPSIQNCDGSRSTVPAKPSGSANRPIGSRRARSRISASIYRRSSVRITGRGSCSGASDQRHRPRASRGEVLGKIHSGGTRS